MSHDSKKKQLFECLDAAEKSLHGSCLEQKSDEDYKTSWSNQDRNRDKSTERYKKKDSIFKQPELPINKCLRARQRPDHERNPEKYKHYTLADVTDTSDRMNSSAAFSFLREMEDRRSKESAANEDNSEPQKIVFKNSTKLRPKQDAEGGRSGEKIIGNKFVMKEYVIGEKRKKPEKKPPKASPSSTSAKQLKLSHLDDDEEDEEDN